MKPIINSTDFGSITIDNIEFDHDVMINLSGQVKKRKKKLSKAEYGTSHIISLEEAKYIYEKGAKAIIIGAGQHTMVKLSDEAAKYFEDHKVQVKLLSTGKAIESWNEEKSSKVIGLFHVTC